MKHKKKDLKQKHNRKVEIELILSAKLLKYQNKIKNEKKKLKAKQELNKNVVETAPVNSRYFDINQQNIKTKQLLQNDDSNSNNNHPSYSYTPTDWQCDNCTLINQLTDEHCTICGNKRPDKITKITQNINNNNNNSNNNDDVVTNRLLSELNIKPNNINKYHSPPQRNLTLNEIANYPVVLIVGESGSGKSTLLKSLYHKHSDLMVFASPNDLEWNTELSVISQFDDDIDIHERMIIFSSIGLNSVPNWLKPFHLLSQGEKYRAAFSKLFDISLKRKNQWILMDEFSSVIDRQNARCMSAAISKYLRKNQDNEIAKFILASTNTDIIKWLQPDLVIVLNKQNQIKLIKNPNDVTKINEIKPDIKVIIDLPSFEDIKKRINIHKLSQNVQFNGLIQSNNAQYLGKQVRRLKCKIRIDQYVTDVSNILDVVDFNGETITDIPYVQSQHINNIFNCGIIYGPSGCGKTTSGERLFGLPNIPKWDNNKNIASHFQSFNEFQILFNVIDLKLKLGLSYYGQLSCGEQHRVNIARQLNTINGSGDINNKYIVIDEYTSYLDRKTAILISKRISKYIHENNKLHIVLLSCHSDIITAVQPDWLFDIENKKIYHYKYQSQDNINNTNNSNQDCNVKSSNINFDDDANIMDKFNENQNINLFQIPNIRIYFKQASNKDFDPLFSKYHYMTAHIAPNSIAFTAWADFDFNGDIDGNNNINQKRNLELVGFTSILLNYYNPSQTEWREHRTVILPSYQGLGFGSRIADGLGEYLSRNGITLASKTAHPRYGGYRDGSPLWEATSANHRIANRINSQSITERYLLGCKDIINKTESTKKKFYSHRFLSHNKRSESAQIYLDSRVIVSRSY